MTAPANALSLLVELVRQRDDAQHLERHYANPDYQVPPECCSIHFQKNPNRHSEGGEYVAGAGVVHIFRQDAAVTMTMGTEGAKVSKEPLEELIWLAHELGHHDSWVAGYRPPRPGEESTADPEAAYAEELRAWHFARYTLSTLRLPDGTQFAKWKAFEREKRSALWSYRRGLKLQKHLTEALACMVASTLVVVKRHA